MTNRPSLRLTLLLAVVLPLLVSGGVAGYLGLMALEGWAQRRLENEVALVARAVRLPLASALEESRQSRINDVLASVFRINRVYSANVYDAEGRQLAGIGAPDPSGSQERLREIAAEGARMGEYGEVGGRGVYSYFVPITDGGGRIIGLLQVTRRRSDIQAEVGRLRLRMVLLLLGSLVVTTAVILYGHHGGIGRHLERLGRTMERVREGDRAERAETGGPREVSAVGASLNSMLDSIARAEQEIEERRAAQRELEARLRSAEKLAALGQLAAGVAHELGSPLSVIAGIDPTVLETSRFQVALPQDSRWKTAHPAESSVLRRLTFGQPNDSATHRR